MPLHPTQFSSRAIALWIASLAAVFLAGVVWRKDSPASNPPFEMGPEPARVERASTERERADSSATSPLLASSPIPPIPTHLDLDPKRVALGRRLFHDPGLSSDGTISCSSCHDIGSGGDDGRSVSIGVGGKRGTLNAPTVLNCAFNFRQFWDGRARTLEDQVDGPLQHPSEMGMRWDLLIKQLVSDPSYAAPFREAYGGSPTQDTVKDAIATFERSLITPGAPFDRYILGDEQALSKEAHAGYELFVTLGCITCHQGINTGGNMFQPLGKMSDFFAQRGEEPTEADQGRFNVTGEERDRFTFKVPTLRNVELTAPYFHDGSVATLEEAVQTMARYQLGEDLTPNEVVLLVAFLRSLTGKLPPNE